MDNKRRSFRLDYPVQERPILHLSGIDTGQYEVIDISETGVRFHCPDGLKGAPGSKLKGDVEFKDGKKCSVSGKIIRFNDERNICAVEFSVGVPLPKMMEEQRLILQKYKTK